MAKRSKKRWTLALLPALVFLTAGCEWKREAPPPAPVAAPQIASSDEENNIRIFKHASPSTVFITNNQLRQDLLTLNVFEIPQGNGSGIVWNKDGYIVTNSHVVDGAGSISVGLGPDDTFRAELVGLARSLDLAVLKIDAPPGQLNPLPLGRSDQLQVGQKVLAIGNPFGLDSTLTTGIISALGREISAPNGRRIRGVIQTDAAINPGNSGGPLLDSSGRLVGINTAILSPVGGSSGIGFAVPINSVVKAVPQLIEHGILIRPVMGIAVVLDRIAQDLGIRGAIVMNTVRGKGADRAGIIGVQRARDGKLMIGDVIIRLGDYSIEDSDDLLNALEQFKPGEIVTVTTLRKGEERSFQVELSEPE